MLLPPTQQAARPVAPRSRLDRPHSRELGATQGGPSSRLGRRERETRSEVTRATGRWREMPLEGKRILPASFSSERSMKPATYASVLQVSSHGPV